MGMRYNRGMGAPKTAGYWLHWLVLYGVACLPAALFGGTMASVYIYAYGHSHHFVSYFRVLYLAEWTAATLCAVPGFVLVAAFQLQDSRKKQARRLSAVTRGVEDDTVWPPAPRA